MDDDVKHTEQYRPSNLEMLTGRQLSHSLFLVIFKALSISSRAMGKSTSNPSNIASMCVMSLSSQLDSFSGVWLWQICKVVLPAGPELISTCDRVIMGISGWRPFMDTLPIHKHIRTNTMCFGLGFTHVATQEIKNSGAAAYSGTLLYLLKHLASLLVYWQWDVGRG